MWHETWRAWRRPLLAGGALLIVGVAGVAWARHDGRRLVVTPNQVMLATEHGEARFFLDSLYRVRLGAHEPTRLPIRLRVWYAGEGMTMLLSEREVRGAIEDAVAARRGAVAEVLGVGVPVSGTPAGGETEVALGLWGEGGTSGTVTLHCGAGSLVVSEQRQVASTRGGLASLLGDLLNDAARLGCSANGAPLAPGMREPSSAPSVSMSSSMSLPAVRAETLPRAASGTTARAPAAPATSDSAVLAAIAATNAPVTRLELSSDTLTLRVGEVLHPERALRLTARRADGTAVLRFVPLYQVENPRVATMGGDGVRGVAPGVTPVVVRVMGGNLATVTTDGASATFYVRVVP